MERRHRSRGFTSFLFRLIGVLRFLLQLSLDVRIGRRRIGGHGRFGRSSLRGSRHRGQTALAGFRLQLLHAGTDRFAHVVLHVLQILQPHRYQVTFRALLATLAGQDHQVGLGRIRRRLAAQLKRIAFTDGALRSRRVHYVQVHSRHKDVGSTIGQCALNTARGRIRIDILRRILRLGVFKRELALYFIRDKLLDVGRDMGATLARAAACAL